MLRTKYFPRVHRILRYIHTHSHSDGEAGFYRIRNIGIIAHIDAGKTTTTERILYLSGLTKRIGDVDTGDTVMDYLPTERERGITINSAAISFDWNQHRINLIDTPGHADFAFEVIRAIRALDGAVVILDAVAGVEAQTKKVWRHAQESGIPAIAFINKMDRPGAGFGRTVRELIKGLQTQVALVNIPYFRNNEFCGIVDIVSKKVIQWQPGTDGKQFQVMDPYTLEPSVMYELTRARTALIENLSKIDEDLVEEFLALDKDPFLQVTPQSIEKSLQKAVRSRSILPVLCGASFRNVGVQPLLDAVNSFLPPPLPPPAIVTAALAFKVVCDPRRGLLVFVRVYSGTLTRGSTILNMRNGSRERVIKLYKMRADDILDVLEISPGNIGVIAGTKDIKTGDVFTWHGGRKDKGGSQKSSFLRSIPVPSPVFSASIEPHSLKEKHSMENALEILLREDPSLCTRFDKESGQTILSGLGELHLEIAHARLVALGAKVRMGGVFVSYRETIQGSVSPVSKSISRAHTNHATVSLSLESQPAALVLDSEGNTLNIGQMDYNRYLIKKEDMIDALRLGTRAALASGGKLHRSPLHSLHVHVSHVTLSMEAESTSAVSQACRLALDDLLASVHETKYSLMEPIMDVAVTVGSQDVGIVTNDISGVRGGRVVEIADLSASADVDYEALAEEAYIPTDHTLHLSKHLCNDERIVKAKVPLRSMVGYLSSLRSLTQGRGVFSMEFDKYEITNLTEIL